MLWETSQHLTSLPPLSPDARRFVAAFLNVDQDVNELAAHLNEDFFDVIRKLCDPPIKAWITAINALKGNERRERALRALDAALTEETNPSAIRRAASRVLRHLELTRPRSAKAPAPVEASVEAGVEIVAKTDAPDASSPNPYDSPCPPTPPHPHRPKLSAAPHHNQARSPRNPPSPPNPPSASPASSSSPSRANSSPSPHSPSSSARAP
jgi:hypothetical protein